MKNIVNDEYENLIEASNVHHNAFYEYLETHGMDETLQVNLVAKYRWLEMIAKKYEIEMD